MTEVQEPTGPRGRSFDRSRLRLGIVIAVILGAMAFLVVQGLTGATQFYRDADDAVAARDDLGSKRFRLQGVVAPDSVEDSGADVLFEVEYNCVVVPVEHRGPRPPSLFQEGIPVVLEGSFVAGTERSFLSDKIIVRHTEEYRTDESQEAEATEAERCS